MAQTTRERIIANPARRLSRAQIAAGFGGKRKQSGLRKRSNRARTKLRTNSRHRRRKKNPGEIIGYTFANNPAKRKKGKTKMAHTKRRRRTRRNKPVGTRRTYHRRRSNPARRHHVVRHRRIRRNPGGMGLGRVSDIAINAVFVVAGALGSKLLAQMVLGANNVGLIGYGANAVAGGILWFLTEKVMKNRNAANGIIAGTAVQIILRLVNDYTPFGQYVAQLGMGDYQAQAFVTPQVLVDPYNNAQIRVPPGWLPPAVTMPAAVGVSGLGADLYGGKGGLY